jgi:hypothetical protein
MSHILLSFYEGRGDHLIAGNIMFDYTPPIGSFVALRDERGNLLNTTLQICSSRSFLSKTI